MSALQAMDDLTPLADLPGSRDEMTFPPAIAPTEPPDPIAELNRPRPPTLLTSDDEVPQETAELVGALLGAMADAAAGGRRSSIEGGEVGV